MLEWMVYSMTCWWSSYTRSLPVTSTEMIHSRQMNNTSKVQRRTKNRLTGDILPLLAVPDTRSSVMTTLISPPAPVL